MTIKELKEELSKYDENTIISFWDMEKGYYIYVFIDDDPLQNHNRVDIFVKTKRKRVTTYDTTRNLISKFNYINLFYLSIPIIFIYV